MKIKTRLDIFLFEKGLVESRAKAQALIMAGMVKIGNNIETKPGKQVTQDLIVSIIEPIAYVSRGGLKLEGALKTFNISVENKICMDIGASTGGFTDCLLQHGAAKVYAVDVGHNQLHNKLKDNPKVINLEGVNFRYFSYESLKEKIEFVTIDVSFISLEKIIPIAKNCLKTGGEIIAMVKPQFEASPQEIKKGVVRDEVIRQKTINKIKDLCLNLNFEIAGEVDSSIKGPKGNLEHFLWLKIK